MSVHSSQTQVSEPGQGNSGTPAAGRKPHAGGNGGHGANWIVTYSDMVTLLMTFFICIITFSSSEPEKYSRKLESVAGGGAGQGVAGELPRVGANGDCFIWRLRMPLGRLTDQGSELAPLYKDPSPDTANHILQALTQTPPGKLSDSFVLRLPLRLLFADGDEVSASGKQILRAVAANIRDLPYDLHVQVGDKNEVSFAVGVCSYLAGQEAFPPTRLAAGQWPAKGDDGDVIWLVLERQL